VQKWKTLTGHWCRRTALFETAPLGQQLVAPLGQQLVWTSGLIYPTGSCWSVGGGCHKRRTFSCLIKNSPWNLRFLNLDQPPWIESLIDDISFLAIQICTDNVSKHQAWCNIDRFAGLGWPSHESLWGPLWWHVVNVLCPNWGKTNSTSMLTLCGCLTLHCTCIFQ